MDTRTVVLVLLLFFGLGGNIDAVSADASGLIPASQFSAEKVASIQKIAESEWSDKRGLGDIESSRVTGCFQTVRPIEGFSVKGDIIWEVRILWGLSNPSGVLWINERTKKVIGLGLYDEQHAFSGSVSIPAERGAFVIAGSLIESKKTKAPPLYSLCVHAYGNDWCDGKPELSESNACPTLTVRSLEPLKPGIEYVLIGNDPGKTIADYIKGEIFEVSKVFSATSSDLGFPVKLDFNQGASKN